MMREIEKLEKRINRNGSISYWKDGILVGKKCTKCGEIKEIKEFTCRPECKECKKAYDKQRYGENVERERKQSKRYYEENKEKKKQYHEANREKRKEQMKEYYKNNKDKLREQSKQWYQNNPEYDKQRLKKHKENDIAKLTEMLEKINPVLKKLNIKPYGSIYKVTNVKTNRVYIGQTTRSLDVRYGLDIIQGWIKERKEKTNQKYLEDLIDKNDFVIEIIDIGCCEYHLSALESYYINKYNSCDKGYNNNCGYYKSNDGIEEFNKLLNKYNLEFENGKLTQIY